MAAVLLCAAAEAGASCVHGTLIAPDGKPVAKATVTLVAADHTVVSEGKSDARGFFRVDPRRRGEFEVRIHADGYVPLVLTTSAGTNLGKVSMTAASP